MGKASGHIARIGTTDIVILCHGFGSSKETDFIANLAAALENAGISSFRFDFLWEWNKTQGEDSLVVETIGMAMAVGSSNGMMVKWVRGRLRS
ncbi:hypothetical protein K1719_040890 [Acacia pycnantha]|nr:hypothetical protein K1719_040890 [Acacia pycnantha]